MIDKLEVPRRKVYKDWYVGLYPDHADHSHPDVHDDSLVQEAPNTHSVSRKQSLLPCLLSAMVVILSCYPFSSNFIFL